MSRPSAPSFPTPRQIREVYETVAALYPGVRIANVGPDGVTFDYGDNSPAGQDAWRGKSFSADGA